MIIDNAKAFAEKCFKDDFGGHDFEHTLRVYRTALFLAERENADSETVALAALLHDVDDRKLSPETCETKQRARAFLESENYPKEKIENIIKIISQVSFVGADSPVPDSIEGKCVQDADRLDATGAIGIARAFAFGADRKRAMYNPEIKPLLNADKDAYLNEREGTTLNHFYEKLFLLKDMMNTETAKALAEKRDVLMHEFVDSFISEWEGQG